MPPAAHTAPQRPTVTQGVLQTRSLISTTSLPTQPFATSPPPLCLTLSPSDLSVDLAKLHLPYRLTSRAELNALKSAGHLSIQAPSSMLMRVEDAVKLMKEKGMDRVRKILRKKLHQLAAPSLKGREKRRHRPAPLPHPHSAPTSPVSQSAPTEPFLLQPSTPDDLQPPQLPTGGDGLEGADAMVGSGQDIEDVEEEGEEGEDEDDDDLFSVSEVSVVTSHQFRLMWQQVASPAPAPALTTATAACAALPLARKAGAAPPRKPRKSPSPFSLSHALVWEWQQRQAMAREERETRAWWSEGDEDDGWEPQSQRRKRRRTQLA